MWGDIALLEDPRCRFCSHLLATLINFLVNSIFTTDSCSKKITYNPVQLRIQMGLDYFFSTWCSCSGVVVGVLLCCSGGGLVVVVWCSCSGVV